MSDGPQAPPPLPRFEATTRVFARALGWSPEELLQRFRPAAADDRAALLAFRNRTHWDDDAYIAWRYGVGRPEHGYGQVWILRHEDGPVFAAIGMEQQPIRHAGRIHRGQLLMDVQIDPDLEGAGGGVWLNQAMFRHGDATLAVGGNPKSIGMVRRLFAPLPSRHLYILPLDAAAALRRRGVPSPLAAMAGKAMDAGWRLRTRWLAPRSAGDLRVEEVERVSDAWLQPLYASLSPQTACIAPEAAHLQWRLRDNPRARYRIFVAWRGEHCVGYLAARRVSMGHEAEYGLHVQDWKVAHADDSTALAALLAHAAAQARKDGCSKMFTTCLAPGAEPVLTRCGFLPGRTTPHFAVGLHASPSDPGLSAAHPWQITDLSFDGDGCF